MTVLESEQKAKAIAEQIVQKYHPQKIILFGSAAKNVMTEDSDFDFLIIKADAAHYGIDRMREVRRLVKKDVAADFLVYTPEEFDDLLRLGDPFLKGILREGKVLYG